MGGDDLLGSTARQRLLQDALGLAHPRTVHVPLVTDETGRRIAKRADDLSLAELRARGVDPRAIVAWAAKSAGMPSADRIAPRDAVAEFSLDRLPREPLRICAAEIAKLLEAR